MVPDVDGIAEASTSTHFLVIPLVEDSSGKRMRYCKSASKFVRPLGSQHHISNNDVLLYVAFYVATAGQCSATRVQPPGQMFHPSFTSLGSRHTRET